MEGQIMKAAVYMADLRIYPIPYGKRWSVRTSEGYDAPLSLIVAQKVPCATWWDAVNTLGDHMTAEDADA